MKEDIKKILFNGISFSGQDTFDRDINNLTENITERFKAFLLWLHDPKCQFMISYNGDDITKDRIRYVKSDKAYTIEEVWHIWSSKH